MMETYEMLEINNVNATTRDVAEKLAAYLQIFFPERGGGIAYLELTADNLRYSFDSYSSNNADSWKEPLKQFLNYIPDAKRIRAEIELYSTEYAAAEDFMDYVYRAEHPDYLKKQYPGYFESIEDPEKLAEYVTYKCLGFGNDSDFDIFAYRFHKTPDGFSMGALGDEEYTEDLSLVKNIHNWWMGDFLCNIKGDEALGTEPKRQELLMKMQEFIKKFGADAELDTDESSYFNINDWGASLKPEQIEEYRAYLQYFYEFALENRARFTLGAHFTPNDPYEFACLKFVPENGKIVAKALLY